MVLYEAQLLRTQSFLDHFQNIQNNLEILREKNFIFFYLKTKNLNKLLKFYVVNKLNELYRLFELNIANRAASYFD
jgi:hypothetical protein